VEIEGVLLMLTTFGHDEPKIGRCEFGKVLMVVIE